MGDWKLIEFFADGKLELYNLADDISEKQNQASLRPELAAALQKRLATWRNEVGARMPTVNSQSDPKKAADWWSRRTNKPLDIEAMRKRYDSNRKKSASKS
jgi:uncharacterized sulfatase